MVKRVPAVAAALLVLGAAPAAVAGPASAHAAAKACPIWNGVQPSGAQLNSVAVLSSCEVFAVGTTGSQTSAMRFEGGAWTQLATPSATNEASRLSGVAALSPDSAWAVGTAVQPPGGDQAPATALILRWDGTSWTSVNTPQPAGKLGINNLAGVAASSAGNAWAVGHYNKPGGPFHTMILHWGGVSWQQVPSPDPGGASRDASLTSVVIVSASDAWAVGWYRSARFFRQTLVLHWNGKAWRQLPSPNGPTNNGLLFGVTATSARNAWAVGYFIRLGAWKTLILHWNGRRWRQQPSPSPSPSQSAYNYNQLLSVTATSASNAWAVGFYKAPTDEFAALILHWNGQSWQAEYGKGLLGGQGVYLYGIASAPGDAWTVGWTTAGSGALASQWNGHAWQPFPGQPPPGGPAHPVG